MTTSGLDSMFFGALATGFDLAGGWAAFQKAERLNVGLVFRDATLQFLKRADGDVHFVCNDGKKIDDALAEISSNPSQRVNVPIEVLAFVPSKYKDPVATAKMTLSMRKRLPTAM